MAIETKTIAEVPAIDALAADDEMLVRDTSKGESARVTMQELADFVGGGGDASTWSQYPATQDVDMDGHDVVGLPEYSASSPPADMTAAASFATVANAMTEAIAGWATAPASQDVDMDGNKITNLGAPTDAADAATKQYVDTVAGAVPTKIENGTSKVEIASSGGNAVVTVSSQMIATFSLNNQTIIGGPFGGRLSLPADSSGHSRITSGGYTSDFTSAGYLYLPSGVASYMHGIYLAKSAYDTLASMPAPPELEWWDPVWTPVSNVDSVSNVECQYTRVYRAAGGSLVTLEGTIEVTPNSAGPCIVQANLPIAMVGSVLLAGTAMAMESSGNVVAAATVQGTKLTLGFVAEGTDPYLVGFRVSYRAA